MKFIFISNKSDIMAFRELKNKINKFVNVFTKSYNIATDKRLTQKPGYEVFFNQRAGIKHPEITPTLPLLAYVHNNSPAIRIATMRLRESIFRRGFEWERKFESKCMKCEKEYEDIVQVCESCGSKDIDIPDTLEVNRADKFFESCNIYDPTKMGRRNLIHLLKEIEDDINIYDDAYLIGIKEYWQDDAGDIKLTTLHQIVRGNPVMMRLVVDELGEPGGRWFTCLRHRDVIEEIVDKKCPKCNRKLYEIHYVSVEGGGDNPMAYYIGDEVIHVSKYRPTQTYGFSPIVTLWQYCLTLTNMIEYIYRSYSEAHLPKGVLAMKTSNPDSAYEFWKDVDDKLNKDPHYIPKMFLEGEGNGTGSGMEFIKFMDTLEEMQYIPVRDEIRRTIASLYGVTNIFIGDTAGVGGLNSESTQIDITNMAAESGISIYNDYIMPQLLTWLNVNDWNYVLQSPFEENKQRELSEQQTQVQIMQSMLQAGFTVELGEEDAFDFKYSGKPKKQEEGGFGGFNPQNPEENLEQKSEWGTMFNRNPPKAPGYGEFELEKAKIYIKHPKEAPQGVKIQRGPRNSYFYETTPQRPHEEHPDMIKRRRIETLLHSTTEHYDNLLDEYKQSKNVNPAHAMSLQDDLAETRKLIGDLHRNYHELFGDQPEMQKESDLPTININIQKMEEKFNDLKKNHDEILKYSGEQEDIYQQKRFKNELNKIFEEEITKIMNNTDKFTGDDLKRFTKQCLDDCMYKMNIHTRQYLTNAYRTGAEWVEKATRQVIDFSKVDKAAIDAILNKHVLWDSYQNLSDSTSEQINKIITEGFKDPKTFSLPNLVNEMKKVADAENYRLERISRTEVHHAAMKGREISFQKTDPEGKNLYKWAVRHDARTSDICKEIDNIVEKEGNGKGLSLNRLNEIIKEISMRHNGVKWSYRDYVPHINCRSGLIRAF